MDQITRLERAKSLGFNTAKPVYHETASDFEVFSPSSAGLTTQAKSAHTGIWTAPDPLIASEYATKAASVETNAAPNILPLYYRSQRPVRLSLEPDWTEEGLHGTILDAWDAGYDSVLVRRPNGAQELVLQSPAQLRSVHAVFDPKKRDSANLLAGVAGAASALGVARDHGEKERRLAEKSRRR